MKSIKKHLEENDPERVAIFEKKAPVQVKKILGELFIYILGMNYALDFRCNQGL